MGSQILQIGIYLFDVYYWLILIAIFGSWFPRFQTTKVGEGIYRIVNPYLNIFRKFIPPLGPIDFSPIIALFAFRFIRTFALEGLRQSLIVIGI